MRTTLKVVAGIVIAVFFLWLALRNIDFRDVLVSMRGISYWWLIPYSIVTLISHYLRSERWLLLVRRENVSQTRDTLFAGVMIGYLVNYAVPRLGEVSRSVYVAKKSDASISDLVGTVVLERVIDLACMMVMITIVVLSIVSDLETMQRIFGDETMAYLSWIGEWQQIGILSLIVLVAVLLSYVTYRAIDSWRRNSASGRALAHRLVGAMKQFWYGLTAIRRMNNWPVFLLTTLLIWTCYALMAYIPFIAFGLTSEYGLGFASAWVVMVISSIGVALPSPGGVGTYHWFVTQSLVVLYSVPAATALAYALVTHAFMMIIIILSTPIIVLIESGGKLNFSFLRRSL